MSWRTLTAVAVTTLTLAAVSVGTMAGAESDLATAAAPGPTSPPPVTPTPTPTPDAPPALDVRPALPTEAVDAAVERFLATVDSPEGWLVAAEPGAVVGTDGRLWTYSVEVEPATGRTLDEVMAVVVPTLEDPDRGWTADGRRRLQRVGSPTEADIRVVLATPDTVDTACARAGNRTNGIYSCWDGGRAMLNLMRWEEGARDFDDIDVYRTYLVNHEVGHGLGLGHVDCTTADAPAPVMMQQTKSTGACEPNGWPSP